jgi:translocation and assembly module TamA
MAREHASRYFADVCSPGSGIHAHFHDRARYEPLRTAVSALAAACVQRFVVVVLGAWLGGCALAPARDPVLLYSVSIVSTGDPALDLALADASRLVTLAERAPVEGFGLIARAEADLDRLDRVLRSFGYYDAQPRVRIADHPLDAPDLPARLAALPAGPPVAVTVQPDPGPRYRLGTTVLEGEFSPEILAAFDLTPGAPARAADVLAAGAAVLGALRESGHALAQVPPPEALVDHEARTLDITYRPEPGPRLALGDVSISGLDRLREDWVRRRLGLAPGEPYSPSRLEDARNALLASGALAWARLTPVDVPDAEDRLPLTLEVAERPRRSLRLSAAYSSDEGLNAAASWLHRNLWGGAEQLGLRGEVKGLTSSAIEDLGGLDYQVAATLRVPDIWIRDLDLRLDIGAVRESPDGFDREAVTAGAALERRFSNRLLASAGVAWERSRIAQEGPAEDYRLLSLPLTLSRDTTDDPLDPRRGTRLALRASPTRVMSGDSPDFTLLRALGSAYLDLGSAFAGQGQASGRGGAPEPGQAVVAARLVLGTLAGATAADVPPDRRFYAGGAGSIRGYPYQSVGPRTPGGLPAGGDALLEAGLELRLAGLCCSGGANDAAESTDEPADGAGESRGNRRGWGAGPWGAALFVDAGAVSRDGVPGTGSLAVGIGIGLRYRTPVGPVRVDLATPLNDVPGSGSVQLYIGIGQAY